jgi:hypothetical protein
MARTWPSGDGVLWFQSATEELSIDPDAVDYLGLSKVANLNTATEAPENLRKIVRRGENGITRRGRNLVRSSCALLERAYGNNCLSFLTLTIPGSASATEAVAERWASVVNRLKVSLRRLLAERGLPDFLVGVVEIQTERFLATGGMPLHLHIVLVGRKSRYEGWRISPGEFRSVWERALKPCNIDPGAVGFRASVDVQAVRVSAAGYLGKYLSKGSLAVQQVREVNEGLVELLPSSWYLITEKMREICLQHVAYGRDHGEAIAAILESKLCDRLVSWHRAVDILGHDGTRIATAVMYCLTADGRALLGVQEPIPGAFTYPVVE